MNIKHKVQFRNENPFIVDENNTYYDISKRYKKYFDYDILTCKVNNDFVDLSEHVKRDCTVEFYDRSSSLGNRVYSRTARFILLLAVEKILGKEANLIFQHSQDKGVYCEIENVRLNSDILKNIETEMLNIVSKNYLIKKMTVSRIDAIKYFQDKKMYDKVEVLKYISNTYINLYQIDNHIGYFYGKMAYSTGQISKFKLFYIKNNSFVLQLPDMFNPECVLDYKHYKKVFNKFNEYAKWGNKLNIRNAADLNRVVSKSKIDELIELSETYYNCQLLETVKDIITSRKKIVLLAGPSSSGKTTTSKKLAVYLKSLGFTPYAISVDDYFLEVEKRPKNEYGEVDFESLDVVDVELFNQDINKLLSGEEIRLPYFNFITGKREYQCDSIKVSDKDIIIIEGIHALNDKLTITIPRDNKYKIFISPLTQINIDNHTHVHTTDTRKLRRIIRDNKTRGMTAEATLKLWSNIQLGEINNILPFQDDVDAVINSSLAYEIGVLKTYVEPLLFNVSEDSEEYAEALRLINFLRNFLTIPSETIPRDSVLREFIGGSKYEN